MWTYERIWDSGGWYPKGDDNIWLITDDKNKDVAKVYEKADAQLIAEAPAMYKLLQDIYPTYYGLLLYLMGGPDEWPQDRTGVVRFKELKTLLEKLKGG